MDTIKSLRLEQEDSIVAQVEIDEVLRFYQPVSRLHALT